MFKPFEIHYHVLAIMLQNCCEFKQRLVNSTLLIQNKFEQNIVKKFVALSDFLKAFHIHLYSIQTLCSEIYELVSGDKNEIPSLKKNGDNVVNISFKYVITILTCLCRNIQIRTTIKNIISIPIHPPSPPM